MSKFLMNDVVKQCCKFKFYIWLTSCVIYIYCLSVIKIFDADLDLRMGLYWLQATYLPLIFIVPIFCYVMFCNFFCPQGRINVRYSDI